MHAADELALLARREAEATSAVSDLADFYAVLRRLGSDRQPPQALQAACGQLLDLCGAGQPSPSEAPQAEVSADLCDVSQQDSPSESTQKRPRRTASPRKRGPGSRSPAGTVRNLLREAFAEHPGRVLSSVELVEMLVARGWKEPARSRHSIYQAMTKLVESETGLAKVGPAKWRYDTEAVSDEVIRNWMVHGRRDQRQAPRDGSLSAVG
ncbi:hypothetical protein [Nocardia sp. AG03]|uniref:hypothetical protein n=1 Tax=Nocardia sp. AG03 TaxID=3025312 RepID=UPI0024188891|nr:hypothetical protein [Nocardia sp. AG03]